MSKRGAELYLTKDDVSNSRMQHQGGPDDSSDPVQRATAAQLATRRIKAAKGRRPGGAPARPTTSFGPPSSTPQQGLFSNGAQSFPPTNGAPPTGNGSPNVSFGGFGSGGGGGSGFDFSPAAPVNNPFANLSASSTTNGASSGGFGFNFGASQPAAVHATSTGIFSFSGNQQPATNPFPSTVSQAPSTGIFGSSAASGSNPFGNPTQSATSGTGLFGSTNGGSAFGTTNGGGLFGSASSTSQQPSGGSLFGQPPAQAAPAAAPFKSFFGTPAPAVKAPFGQPVDDAMSTSPDNSPNRGEKPASNHWNKPLETVANGVTSSSSSNGEDSPDHPHIEEEKTVPNPFASIPRAPSSEPPKVTEKPAKALFDNKKSEVETPHIEEETSRPNPFASIARSAQAASKPADSQLTTSTTPSFFNLGQPKTGSAPSLTSSNSTTPKTGTTSIFSQNPIVGQSPIVGENSSTNAKVDSTFKPSTQSSSIFKVQAPSQPTPTPSTTTNMFGLFSKAQPSQDEIVDDATAARVREVGTVLPQDRTRDLSKYLTPAIRASILSDDTLQFPSSESGMDEEELKYWAREHKLHKLNSSYKQFFMDHGNDPGFEWMDLRPMMANYIALYEELFVPIEGPLSKLIATNGKEQGYRLFYQQNGSMPDESGKRKPGNVISREDDVNGKKAKIDTQAVQPATQSAQSSATANKFANFLSQPEKATPSSQSGASVNGTAQKSKPVEPAFKMPTFSGAPPKFTTTFGEAAAKEAAKAKQKAKDEEFDSDEDDLAEWEREYAAKLAAKAAKVAELAKSASGFQFKPSVASSTPSSSLAPPTTNGGFNFSRSVSPAASATGSIFDAAQSSTPSASNNIFGHLSNAGSDVEGSAKGDADDEDSDEDHSQQSNGAKPSSRFGGFSESDGDTPTAGRSLFDRVEKRAQSSTPSANPFGFPKPAEQTNSTPGGSLFGRVSREDSSERTPLATTAANEGGLFGFGTKTATAGDQTWKPDSPIQFGKSTVESTKEPPKFAFTPSTPGTFSGGLFGSSTPSTSTFKSTGFSFSPIGSTTTPASSLFGASNGQSLFPPSGSSSVLASATTSRATTPGISDVSGAETTGGEQEEFSNDPQSDLIGMEEAKRGHDVLYENEKVKACRHEKDPKKQINNNPWPTQGLGPIAVLKDQATGVTKILMKKVPGGGIVINTRLMAQTQYSCPPDSAGHPGKRARFFIIDPETKLPASWIVQFSSSDEAAAFVKACEENKSQ